MNLVIKSARDFFKLLPHYSFSLRTLLYFSARWLVTPYSMIEKILPKEGVICDIGCGEGILANLAALNEPNRRVIGFDLNERRINTAKRVSFGKIPNIEFQVADALSYNHDNASAVIMIDVLHHIPDREKQEEIIKKISQSMRPNTIFVIREPAKDDFLKGRITYWGDKYFLYRGDTIIFRTKKEWQSLLEANNFEVKIYSTNCISPVSSYVFVATRNSRGLNPKS